MVCLLPCYCTHIDTHTLQSVLIYSSPSVPSNFLFYYYLPLFHPSCLRFLSLSEQYYDIIFPMLHNIMCNRSMHPWSFDLMEHATKHLCFPMLQESWKGCKSLKDGNATARRETVNTSSAWLLVHCEIKKVSRDEFGIIVPAKLQWDRRDMKRPTFVGIEME